MPHAIVSVIIPVLHESVTINEIVDHVFALSHAGERQVIVSDGGEGADTLAALRGRAELDSGQLLLVKSPPGRARQMNEGAAKANGDVFLFLHADTRLPYNGLQLAANAVLRARPQDETRDYRQADASKRPCAGAFGLSMRTASPALRVLIRLADLRNRITRTPYGDQAQFFRADVFRELGGFSELPLMEDVDIMRRLRGAGRRIVVLDQPASTSPRRYEAEGVWYAALRNVTLRTLYALGVSPRRLARWYAPKPKARA